MPVQRHARLQAQGVPAGQTTGDESDGRTRVGQRLPHLLGVARRHEQLEAVLAGVSGARDEGGDTGDRAGQARVVLQAVEIGVGEGLQNPRRLGALDGDQRVGVPVVADDRVEAVGPLDEGVEDDLCVACVGHHQVFGLGQPVDDQVVEDAAVGPADHRVAGAAHGDGPDVADQRVVEEGGGLRPRHGDLAHVGEVEETGLRAHGQMLVALGAVPQGMSQPAKSVIVAPSERCRASSAVLRGMGLLLIGCAPRA